MSCLCHDAAMLALLQDAAASLHLPLPIQGTTGTGSAVWCLPSACCWDETLRIYVYIYIWCLWNGYNLLWWCTVAGFFKETVKQIYVKSSCCNYRFVMMFHPWRLSNSYSSYEYLCFWAFQLRGILNFPSYILHYIRILYIYTYRYTSHIHICIVYQYTMHVSLSLSKAI